MAAPPLTALRAFEAIARHRSLSRAGDELRVTHAAVSHQLKNLEDWFGVPMAFRSGRGIQLTPIGEGLARQLTAAFRQLDAACEHTLKLTKGGYLRVGCIPSIASRWLVPHLADFGKVYPDAEIEVVYAKADDRLAGSLLDVLITYTEDGESGVRSEYLFSRINKPVCSRSFLEKWGAPKDATWFSQTPLLHDEAREAWWEWLGKAGIQTNHADTGPIYPDFNMLATAVIAGHGVALCPIEVFRQEIASGDLIVLSEVSTKSDNAYFAKIRENAQPIATAFVSWFVGCIREINLVSALVQNNSKPD